MFFDRLLHTETSDDMIWDAFHRLRGYRAPAFDMTEGHPHATTGLAFLHAGNWAGLRKLYEAQGADDRHHWLDAMGAIYPMSHSIPKPPDEAWAYTLVGGILVGMAWRARGWGSAHTVPDANMEAYQQILEEAEWALDRAAQQDALDVVTTSFRLRAGLGLGLNTSDIHAYESRLLVARERSLFADNTMLMTYARKWYGSHGAMWHWAEGRAGQEAVDAPAWHALIARAEIETWMWECHMAPEPAARTRYLEQVKTQAFTDRSLELQARFLDGLNRSDAAQSAAALHYAHNVFAVYFHLFGPKQALVPHLEAIGDKPALVPWVHTGIEDDSIAFLNAVRRKAGMNSILQKTSGRSGPVGIRTELTG